MCWIGKYLGEKEPLTAYRVKKLKELVRIAAIQRRISSLGIRRGDKCRVTCRLVRDNQSINIEGYFSRFDGKYLWFIETAVVEVGDEKFYYSKLECSAIRPSLLKKL